MMRTVSLPTRSGGMELVCDPTRWQTIIPPDSIRYEDTGLCVHVQGTPLMARYSGQGGLNLIYRWTGESWDYLGRLSLPTDGALMRLIRSVQTPSLPHPHILILLAGEPQDPTVKAWKLLCSRYAQKSVSQLETEAEDILTDEPEALNE